MELDTDVWIKGKESKKNANDAPWSVGRVVSKDVDHSGVMTIIVRNENGDDFMFSSSKGGIDLEEIQLKNATSVNDVDNLIELPYLNEPEIIHSLSTRYFQRKIYTYTGNILIAINPLQAIVPDDSCQGFLQHFTSEIKTLAVGMSDVSSSSAASSTEGDIKRHSIIITGESGSGKTECAKLLTMFMISAEVKSSKEFLGVQVAVEEDDVTDEDEVEAGSEDDNVPSAFRRNISQDSMLCDSVKEATPLSSPVGKQQQSTSTKSFGGASSKSGYFKAYQLTTMERIRQVTPILEAFGNACIVHTHNSSRLGKYAELSFTKRGELVSGEIRTYLLENVRVIRQLAHERNFHVFYQLAAGASDADRERWALGDISSFHYANQGGKQALRNPLVNDRADFARLKENFNSLGLESDIVESIFCIVAGILHLGQINFASVSQLEGQVAKVIDQCVHTGERTETELVAAARLCSFSSEELQRSLTVRSVVLNKELFHKSLTPEQAVNSRDAVAKAVYKRLFTWLVQELNSKLRPTDSSVPAEITSSVGVLDIFGFDSFTVNTFEQLCINYANEALQQHFAQHMFKLELLEYKREGIPFENIEFPDNQESLDLITSGLFTILDDQCRIPNATDKRYASQLYKELSASPNFSANATQIGSNLFCVQHFAGPVVYTTDKFIEKNLDELPQDAANLLKNSRNPVLSDEILLNTAGSLSPSSGPGSLPKPPVMAAYVSKPKMEPGSRVPAARRGSLGGKSLYSVVAQLRDEVSVMMAHINTTVPHYVCCINPVERVEDGISHHASKGKSAQFHTHVVADQLRYGGILGAVKVARSGLPHRFHFVDFFRRYRSLANPLNPVSKKLAEHITDGEEKAKEQSELLLQALRNTSSTAVVVSAVQSRLAEEMQVIFRKRSVRQWMGAIGGVINEGGFAVGHTKVFIGKQAHILLESCLYHQLALCRKKIGDLILKRIHQNRFAHTQRMIRLIQRVARGALARIQARLLARRKAAGAEKSESPKRSPTPEGLDEEVREVKRQDALIQEQIRRLVASNKATEEPEYLTLDVAATKQELLRHAAKFSSSSVLSVKTIEASEHVGEGFEMLRPDKIIPLTTVGKALSFGHNVKIKTRTNAVKFANKLVTKDHPVFKNLHKLMDRLRELFELAKLEKEVLENRKRNQSRSAMTPIPSPAPSTSGKSSPPPLSANADIADIDVKLATLDKIAKLARTIYQYFHQYILEMVKEYGPDSRYKAGFADENLYLLAFVELVDRRKPMLCFEKPSSGSATAEEGESSATKNFPLYIPSERHQGPQHQGLLPLCTYGGVQFKVIPISHTPGVEYAVNTFYRLLQGRHLMYPIKYLKIIGKSGEGKGKESFYQAATEFAQNNLESIDRDTPTKLSVEDFSSMMICSVIFGAKVIHPHHIMADISSKSNTAEISLRGVSCDSAFLSHLFKYKASDAAHTEDLNLLYMMTQMDAPVPSAMVDLLTKPGAAASLVSAWLRELTLQNKRFAALKSAGFTPADMTTLSLPIVLPNHAGAQVQHMLTKVCKTLQKASVAQQVLTHSDLLVSLESALAERYAELRIRYSEQPSTTYRDLYDACHAERAASVKADPQIKRILTMDVDHTTAEVLNTLDFTTLSDGSNKSQEEFSTLFDNVSFLPSLHLRNISESQLRAFFSGLIERNRAAHLEQIALRPACAATTGAGTGVRQLNSIHPAIRTAVKSVVICGLSQTAAKQLAATPIIRTIQHDLGMKVSFDVATASSSSSSAAAKK